ncbi:MAG: DUF6531 domain-containing protein, partial [Acidobacteria bacterium]|nr:DUF6531 domain-containing protein [Acidobacteriota bacterium]
MGAALTDQSNYQEQADSAESESDAKEAAAYAEASGIEAKMAGIQAAADIVAMALSVGMGKDPGITPFTCWGNFITGSQNVLIGGLPMPGWLSILRGLGKLLKRRALKISQRMGVNKGCGRLFEPIDVVTGANVDEFTDFTLPASGFVWRRWYNSQQQQQGGPLGRGFRHEYQLELRYDQSTYTYTDQEGNSVRFPPFFTNYPGERVVQHGYVLKRMTERQFELTAHNHPTIEFEFCEMSELARPVALRDGERNFSFDYDALGRLIRIQIDEVNTIRMTYSPAGLLKEVSLEQSGQKTADLARYRHDDDGCLVEFRDALDQVARYEYNREHRMTRKTDRRKYSYLYRYDEQGRCVYTSGEDGLYEGWLEYHPAAMLTVVKYSDGGSWTYEYNELGTITKIIDPYGGTQHRLVDPDTGIVMRELDPAGNPTELLYDGQGAHTGRRDLWGYWAPPLDVEPHPPDPLEHKVPETPLEWEFGKLLKRDFIGTFSPDDLLLKDFPEVAAELAQSSPRGSGRPRQSSSQVKHDLLGRLIEKQNEDGSIERWEFDAEGNEVLYVDGDDGLHRKDYASWNLLHRETGPAGNTCVYQYSPTEEITRFVDAGGAVHDFVYDKKDRLVEVRRNGVAYDIYRYDEADNLLEKMDGKGRSLLVCDPGIGRLDQSRYFSDGEIYRFEYNKRGRITRAKTRRDNVVIDYDEEGRLIKDIRDGLGVEHEFVGNELISTAIFEKFVVKYEKEYNGGLIITDPTGRAHTFYYSAKGLILRELANGSKVLNQYDDEGRCLRKTSISADGVRHNKNFHYSVAGDLLLAEDSRSGKVKYHYDSAHRLKVAEREDGRTELYAHDKAGNLVLQPGLDGVSIADGNKLKQANGERFRYDHRDNLVRREREKRWTSYEYDSFDQLVGISLNSREWQASYDALGRRTRKRWSGETTEYYWDNDRLAGEIRANGSVRLYLYADEFALVPFLYIDYTSLAAEPESGVVKYVFTNHLGVPERVEDDFGKTIWQGEVFSYGDIRTEAGNRDEINLRFPGHYYDVETGLHYNRFRYYDPTLGCYLQCDPLGLAGGSNLYAYLANPLTGVDILGLHPKGPARSRRRGNGAGRPASTDVPISRALTRAEWKTLDREGRIARNPRPVFARHMNEVGRHQKKYKRKLDRARQRGESKQSQGGYKAKITEARGETGAARHMALHHPEYEMVSGFAPGTGYDQVYVKRNSAGQVSEYMVVEAKGPGAELSTNAKKGPQMSKKWMENSAKEGARARNPVAKDIQRAMDKGPPPDVRGKVIQTQGDGS